MGEIWGRYGGDMGEIGGDKGEIGGEHNQSGPPSQGLWDFLVVGATPLPNNLTRLDLHISPIHHPRRVWYSITGKF